MKNNLMGISLSKTSIKKPQSKIINSLIQPRQTQLKLHRNHSNSDNYKY